MDLSSLAETEFTRTSDQRIETEDGEQPVFRIDGRSMDQGFFVRYGPRESGSTNVSYPSCTARAGDGAYVFNAEGANPEDSRFGPPPPPTGNPTPTPPPTPTWDPSEARLDAERWLELGWPDLSPERLALQFEGTRYDWVRSTYIGSQVDHWIPRGDLETVRVLEITYPLPELEELPPELTGLVSPTTVMDRVRISRPESTSESGVIVVENCAADLQPYEYTYYAPVSDGD